MSQVRTKPEDIANWLGFQFDASEVDTVYLDDRTVYLFRIYDRDRSPFPTLSISRSALEDWDFATIVRDLDESHAVERLKQNPGVRLIYLRSRGVEVDSR